MIYKVRSPGTNTIPKHLPQVRRKHKKHSVDQKSYIFLFLETYKA